MTQAWITVVVRFSALRANYVDQALDGLGNPANLQLARRLEAAAFIHFMSMIVVPARGVEKFAHLVIEASTDGHARAALEKLAAVIPDELLAVLEAAGIDVPPRERLGAFLEARRLDVDLGWLASLGWFATTGLAFTGTPGMSVRRILDEARLAARIRELLDADAAPDAAMARLERVRAHIFKDATLKWAFVSEPVPLLGEGRSLADSLRPLFLAALRDFFLPLVLPPVLVILYARLVQVLPLDRALWHFALAIIIELLLALLVVVIGYWILRRQEIADVPFDAEPDEEEMRKILARENPPGYAQNHLACVSFLKPGLVRRVTLRLALWLIGENRAHISKPGFIDKIGTIHFARWLRLPGTDRLVFLSNYDGSWQSYLEDFIARLREGLTSVWSNTRDFPKTANLIAGGAGDGARFKRWARRQQVPTRFWYSAYRRLSTDRIRTHAAIRHGFAAAANEIEAAQWLALFGFAPPDDLEKDEISPLVFGGLPLFRHAHCLLIRFTADPLRDPRRWLRNIERHLSYGEHAQREESAWVVAFTRTGLEKLGLDTAAIRTFPTAFQQGMHDADRARSLGDDNPGAWSWGGAGEVDAVLLLYAQDARSLRRQIRAARQNLRGYGDSIEVTLPVLDREGKEPFGFKDGISQPIMRGSKHWSEPKFAMHVVEPGELVLGYRDNLGNVSPSPCDHGRDIGRNGTFLVVRQLEQHVAEFDRYLAQEAARLREDPRAPGYVGADLEHWIAARMVGRWRDGSSLVRYPHPPPPSADDEDVAAAPAPQRGERGSDEWSPDNEFRFGKEDPAGLRCPLGAHIRRANPRDSFEPGSEVQLAITNRHRILRVGRVYRPQQGGEPGLLFMCINADIERQFEFLQQTWLLGPNFHGLDDEIDPVVGYRDVADSMTVPTPRGPVRMRGLSKFVSVLGGAYFFVPGRSAIRMLSAP
jgi:Dyp-type peroxidase family